MISQIIVNIMAVFAIIGALDLAIFKNKFGLGNSFKEGIYSCGTLALAMVGIMCFAPVIGSILDPVFSPLFNIIGVDPAIIAGSLLPVDMGGYSIAKVMTSDSDIVALSGIFLATTLGTTIIFSIPVSINIVKEEDNNYLALGIMAGIIAIPIGSILSSLIIGMNFKKIIINLLPTIIFSAILVFGLIKYREKTLKIFEKFADIINILLILTLVIAIVQELTGIIIVKNMAPILPQFQVVGHIAITLSGAYPLVSFINRKFTPILSKLGKKIGVNSYTITGMITVLTSTIPMYNMIEDMNPRGKVMAMAFSVPAIGLLGAHFAFVVANEPDLLIPALGGKLFSGILAIIIAMLLTRDWEK